MDIKQRVKIHSAVNGQPKTTIGARGTITKIIVPRSRNASQRNIHPYYEVTFPGGSQWYYNRGELRAK